MNKIILAVLTLSFLSACGGGGGGAASIGSTERLGAIQERVQIVPEAAANSN